MLYRTRCGVVSAIYVMVTCKFRPACNLQLCLHCSRNCEFDFTQLVHTKKVLKMCFWRGFLYIIESGKTFHWHRACLLAQHKSDSLLLWGWGHICTFKLLVVNWHVTKWNNRLARYLAKLYAIISCYVSTRNITTVQGKVQYSVYFVCSLDVTFTSWQMRLCHWCTNICAVICKILHRIKMNYCENTV